MKPGGPAFQSSDWHCGTAQEYQASGSGRIVLGTDGDKRGSEYSEDCSIWASALGIGSGSNGWP